MEAWLLYIQIQCAEPRLNFKQFFLARNQRVDPATIPPPSFEDRYSNKQRAPRGSWLYDNGETMDTVVSRAMDTAADYMDYVVKFNEQCKGK